MARVYPFPIDLSKSLDDLGLTGEFPFSHPEELSKAFDYSFMGTKGTSYLARREDAIMMADRRGHHVFEFSYRLESSSLVGFYGFSVASCDRDLRDRFAAFLIMTS